MSASSRLACVPEWARDMERGKVVRVRYAPPSRAPSTHAEMQQLESYFQALDGYLWLAERFPLAFAHRDKVVEYRAAAAGLIEAALDDPPTSPRKDAGWRAGTSSSGGRKEPKLTRKSGKLLKRGGGNPS